MLKFSYPGLEPVEFLEQVRLPYPRHSVEPTEERPIVNIYRYRFSGNRGVEVCTYSYLSTCTIRYLEYAKDSNTIKKASGPSWSLKEAAKKAISRYIRDSDYVYSELRH